MEPFEDGYEAIKLFGYDTMRVLVPHGPWNVNLVDFQKHLLFSLRPHSTATILALILCCLFLVVVVVFLLVSLVVIVVFGLRWLFGGGVLEGSLPILSCQRSRNALRPFRRRLEEGIVCFIITVAVLVHLALNFNKNVLKIGIETRTS